MKTVAINKVINKDYIFIDVRTPKEYDESTIPGAINIPLFSNEERAVVGKLYTKQGQEEAIKKGLEFVSKKLPNLIENVSKYKDKEIIIFCWRGGMRSKSLSSLLDSLGYKVSQLEGGYKAYRNYILKQFEDYKIKPKLIVLHGLTGSGKTEILNKFDNSLDLEDIAQHRSSLLGCVGLKPRSQKMFDSLLFNRLEELQKEKFIIIEGEARKIGRVQMPLFLFKTMKKGIKVKIVVPTEERVKRLVDEYTDDKEEIIERVKLLTKALGKKKIEKIVDLIEKEDFSSAAKIILEEYYDPLYKHTVENIDYDYVIEENHVEKLKNILKN